MNLLSLHLPILRYNLNRQFFLLLISLFFCTNTLFSQPINDKCANALPITISQSGYGIGKFTSAETDISNATVETNENFYSTIASAGQTEKSIWYKFTLPTSRKCTFSLKQNGNDIPGNSAGFTVYLSNTCMPESKQAENAMLASQSVFGSSTYPCMKPGEYLVQITSLASSKGKLFVELDLDYTNVNYDNPETALNFGVLTGNKCLENSKIKFGCYTVKDNTEKCADMGPDFTQSVWYTFTTDNYFDYVSIAYRFMNGIDKKEKIGFKLYKGNGLTDPFSSLQLVDGCSSDSLSSNIFKYKHFICNKLLTNTSYSIQILANKNITDEFELCIQKVGTAPSNGIKPLQSAIQSPNKIGILTELPQTISDYFACNTRIATNVCGNANTVTTKPDKYNLATWFTFELTKSSNLELNVNYPYGTKPPLIRIFNKIGQNCGDIDTALNRLYEFSAGYPNSLNKFYCIPAGNYSIQILGYEDFNFANPNDIINQCYWGYHLGQKIDVTIAAKNVKVISDFSLNKSNAFDPINKPNTTLIDLTPSVVYPSKIDTIGCENTVLPDGPKCSPISNKAVYNQFQVKDSGFVYLDVNWPHFNELVNWNILYKGDANNLSTTQNKHLFPETFTGLNPFTECYANNDLPHIATSCLTPGIYTHVNLFDSTSITKTIDTKYKYEILKPKYSKPALAENMGDILQKMASDGKQTLKSTKDYFTCIDNPYTIDGLAPCDGINGQNKKTKLSFRQFYLNKNTYLRIIPKGNNIITPYTYSLFSGKASDGVNALKRINSSWECTTDTLPCSSLNTGWYTVVIYGEGPNYKNPKENYFSINGAGGEVGAENYIEFSILPLKGQKYNLPSKACVDSLTKQPFKLFLGKGGLVSNPKFDTTYNLYPEYFNCSVDTPFYKHPVKPCDSINYRRVAYYTINIMQESFLRLQNLPAIYKENLICNVYKGNVKANATILKALPLQPCIRGNYTEICRIQPGIYTIVIFIPNVYNKDSIVPQVYLDKIDYSLHDFATKAYDFGLIPSDTKWHNGKTGDTHPVNPSFSPSTDGYYCTTGAFITDPADFQISQNVSLVINPTVYKSPPTNNVLYTDANLPASDNELPRKNLWYTFKLKGGGNCTVRMKGLNPSKPTSSFAIYKSQVDGKIDFKDLVKNKLVDSTKSQGLKLITSGINEARFYRDVCSNFEERYYILAESEFNANQLIDCEIYWDIQNDNRTGDYCSLPVSGEIKQIGDLNLSANITCHTIGESFGEDGTNMSCLIREGASLESYKSTWFRFDIIGIADTFNITPIINNITNVPGDSIRYRLLYGDCGAMNTGSCFVSSSTKNVFECLIKGSYFLQVITPTLYTGNRTEGIIEMKLNVAPNSKKCSPVNPCYAIANFKSFSTCYTDTISFINLSTAGDSIKYKWTISAPYTQILTSKNPQLVFPITNLSETIEVKLRATNPYCDVSDSITKQIIVYKKPKLNLGKDTILCYQKSLPLNITTHLGTNYKWDNGSTSPIRTITQSGKYYATSALSLCTISDTLNIIVNPDPNPIITLNPIADTLCANKATTLLTNASGNNGFEWEYQTTSSTTWNKIIDSIPFTGSTTNQLIINPVKNLNDFKFRSVATEPLKTCYTYSKEIQLKVLPLPEVTVTSSSSAIHDSIIKCQEDQGITVTLETKNGNPKYYYYYTINNESFIDSTNNPLKLNFQTKDIKNYAFKLLKVVDKNTCENEVQFPQTTINIKKKPVLNFETMDTTGCVPLNSKFKEISTEGPYDQIQWIFGDDTDTLTTKETVYYNFNKLGKYTITAIAELDGCFDTLTRFNYINIVKPPVANFTANKLITTVFDRIITFNNTSTGNVNYLEWNFGDFSPKSSKNTEIHEFPDATNTYLVQLTAYTSPDCYNSKTITIKVNEENICYVPNTFTPDGDEFNNVFIPRFGMSLIPNSYSFLIFNRWGELVFESHDPLVGWDGSYGNQMCPVGTYTWEILYQEAAENKKNKLVGHVNIIK